MSVLSDEGIRELCKGECPLVEGWAEERIQGASYDLSQGKECYLYDAKKRTIDEMIRKLRKDEAFYLPAYATCYIITEEKVNLPKNLSARISLRNGLVQQGVSLSVQAPIDPGYSGRIACKLHNLSSKEVSIKRGDHVITIEFMELSKPTTRPYAGSYQNMDSLGGFISTGVESGLAFVWRSVNDWRTRLEKLFPLLLVWLTIIVTILTVIVAVGAWREMAARDNSSKREATSPISPTFVPNKETTGSLDPPTSGEK